MKNKIRITATVLLTVMLSLFHGKAGASVGKLKVQIVFCLDATGSMSGLIAAAKEKIWSIAGSIAAADSAPDITMGMVYYRDRGDAFVTKVTPLTVNLDGLYTELIAMKADQGGDTPESVNKALYDAVHDMKWSQDTTVLKYIFLVGDCPPHMNYDETKYPEICERAKKKDIVINTILMGGNSEARMIWQEIASKTGGEFIQTDMAVRNFEVHSPYDAEIKKLSEQLDQKRYYCRTPEVKVASISKMEEADKLKVITEAESARRCDYNLANSTNVGNYYGTGELLHMISTKKVKLEDVKEKELPEALAKIEKDKREAWVAQQIAERDSIQKTLTTLLAKRQEHINKELAAMKKEDVDNSFNAKVYNIINTSATRKGYKMKSHAKF
ncbi:MAG: hypothetical protein FD123_3656 [Bacteroidetes bacterium]|nr:MAG: hypothetical protein FD123_3656 [Bacteroidota bacterium]